MRAMWLAMMVLVLGCTPTHAQTPHGGAALDLEGKTVALVRATDEGVSAYCSGVWVADDAFVTANHCVEESTLGDDVLFATRDDVSALEGDKAAAVRFGKLEAIDAGHDIALVRVTLAPAHPVAHVASRQPYVGEDVQTMGHPYGLWWSYSRGTVAALRVMAPFDDDSFWYVQSTAAASPGNSGGGLFDEAGDLVGLCRATVVARGAENLNLYVHAMYVSRFLAAHGIT